MPTVHFVYTVPRSKNIIKRAVDKALRKIAFIPPLHRFGNDWLISWQRPIRAPHSISYHLLKALQKHYKVKFYSLYEHTVCKIGSDDILIAQPVPDGGFGKSRADHDDPLSVTSQTLAKYPHNKKIIIMPFANDTLLVSWAADLVKKYGDNVILIGGKIWTDQLSLSPFKDASIKKLLRLDMGIDMDDYPLVKQSFNPEGTRKFLYIGHTSWYKNTIELERIAHAMPQYEYGHIGGGTIAGWKKIADFADLTPEYMSTIAQEYDIFLTTSTADAQATTILEQMCFGLVVACTPETGYEYPSLIKLHTSDTQYNCGELEKLQKASEDELKSLVRANREIATTVHSWQQFCDKTITFVKEIEQGR